MTKYLLISLCIAILFLFGSTLFLNVLNLPSFDDYDTTLGFIKRLYFEDNTYSQKLNTLLSRHNEHRILISKVTAALYYSLFQEVNFAHLVLLQNLFLIAFFSVTLAVMQHNRLLFPETVFVAVIFIFSLSFWQVTYYYWGGIQHYSVFFFSFLSLFQLNKSEKILHPYFLTALLAAILAVLSFGNGFIALFLGAFILFAQKKWPLLLVWGIFSAVLLLYTFLPDASASLVTRAPFHIEWMARLLFTFLGSYFYINPSSGQYLNIVFCMVTGALVFFYWIYLFIKGYAFKEPLLYSLLSLPVLTGIIIAISRFETKSAGGIAPRYMFFTATIPVMLMLVLLDQRILKIQHLRWAAIPALMLWGIIFYTNFHALKTNNKELVSVVNRWQKDPGTPLIYYRDAAAYSQIMQWAIEQNVVQIQAPEPQSNTVK